MRNRNEPAEDRKTPPQRDDQNDRERRTGSQTGSTGTRSADTSRQDPLRSEDDDEAEDVEDIEDARQDPKE